MKHIYCTAISILCCAALSVASQDDTKKAPSLQDAKSMFDVIDAMNHENDRIDKDLDKKQQAALRADIFMAASDKLLEIAKDQNDRNIAHSIRLAAFQFQIEAGMEDAEQKMEAFLDELAAKEETRYTAEGLRFQRFLSEAMKTANTPEGWKAFKKELKPWLYRNIDLDDMYIRASRITQGMDQVAQRRAGDGDVEPFLTELVEEMNKYIMSPECTLSNKDKATAVTQFDQTLELHQFGKFYGEALKTVDSPEKFETFKAELKPWIKRKTVNVDEIPALALLLAEKCGVPAEPVIDELMTAARSQYGENHMAQWKKMLLTAFGSDLKLYGRTLDDKEFDWAALRGKYVLVQFTATWCGPCHMEIPGMKEVYAKYRDKGFEIVSIYVGERGENPVASVKEHVENSKLPWIILSETLTEKSGQPKFEESFAINGVPTMLLVDKTGKIIMTSARGESLQTKLAEIFE